MERVIRERMTTQEMEEVTPKTLINIRPVTAAMKEFFGEQSVITVYGPNQSNCRTY